MNGSKKWDVSPFHALHADSVPSGAIQQTTAHSPNSVHIFFAPIGSRCYVLLLLLPRFIVFRHRVVGVVRSIKVVCAGHVANRNAWPVGELAIYCALNMVATTVIVRCYRCRLQ